MFNAVIELFFLHSASLNKKQQKTNKHNSTQYFASASLAADLMHSVLFRVTAWSICSHLPTCGSWVYWWSSSRGKRSPPWRAKWANWSTTRLQVSEEARLCVCRRPTQRTMSPELLRPPHPSLVMFAPQPRKAERRLLLPGKEEPFQSHQQEAQPGRCLPGCLVLSHTPPEAPREETHSCLLM